MHHHGQDLSDPIEIVTRLRAQGFQAYFAGGWVRDFLLGRSGSDVDIATDAHPEQITALFDKTVSVGASFGVIIVMIEGVPYEVATFRQDGGYQDGRHPESITFCGAKEDAQRRDFTINGLFYDPLSGEIIDYVGGRQDLTERRLRAIGDPKARFREDHLRILRAIRFAVRLGFQIDEPTRSAIATLAPLVVEGVSVERIRQELDKMAQSADLLKALHLCRDLSLLEILFPGAETLPAHLDPDLPLILQLCSLFRSTPEKWSKLADHLKMSGEERRMAETLQRAYQLLIQPHQDRVEWAHYLARPWSQECLEALFCWSGPFPVSQEHIEELRNDLEDHVYRIEIKQPLVSAAHLMMRGLSPGPEMGHWLREAERIAIEQDLHDSEEVLDQLPRWRP